MKPGDLLYTVYEDDWDDDVALSIETAEIVKVGAKTVEIRGVGGKRTGLAFNCRTRISIERAGWYGTTAREAWEKYADRLSRAIDEGERELVKLRRNYHQAIEQAIEETKR
jgi:hypothetical protein